MLYQFIHPWLTLGTGRHRHLDIVLNRRAILFANKLIHKFRAGDPPPLPCPWYVGLQRVDGGARLERVSSDAGARDSLFICLAQAFLGRVGRRDIDQQNFTEIIQSLLIKYSSRRIDEA